MKNSSPITDHDRFTFMMKLANASRDDKGLMLTPWEQEFVWSWRRSSSPTSGWFTGPRRIATDRLRMKYGCEKEINMVHPSDLVTERPKIADADPTRCQYLVKSESGRQERCNATATCREPGRLRYCETHGEEAVKAMKRSGVTLRLIRLT